MFKKHYLATAAAGLLLATTLIPSGASAEVATKNLQAKYNNIKVLNNGYQISTPIEPFIVNGTTYIPLRMMADVFKKDVTWDGKTYTINVIDKPDASVQSQLAIKDAEIARLKNQITSLQDEIENLEDKLDKKSSKDDDFDDELSDLEDELNSDYDDFEDMEWTITLSGDEDEIEVEIELDDDYIDDFDDIKQSKLEGLVEDIVKDIWKEFDADITGEIIVDDYAEHDFEANYDDDEIFFDDEEIS